MTDSDLQYLKRATPAQLLKLTNNVTWERCATVRLQLTTDAPVSREAVRAEWDRWLAAGAVHTLDFGARERQLLLRAHCDECGFFRWPDEKTRRFSFSKAHGFMAHCFCSKCAEDFSNWQNPMGVLQEASKAATRFQGRCFGTGAAAVTH
jgi:hypothetical protein